MTTSGNVCILTLYPLHVRIQAPVTGTYLSRVIQAPVWWIGMSGIRNQYAVLKVVGYHDMIHIVNAAIVLIYSTYHCYYQGDTTETHFIIDRNFVPEENCH